ncbi:MAG: hypothetical protein ACKOE4_07945 [Candidatus Kapaibacterium sp.]
MNENRTNVRETIGTLLGGCYASVTSPLHWILRPVLVVALCGVLFGTTSAQVQRVMVASVKYDTTDSSLQPPMLFAGLSLAFELSKQYSVIPMDVRDAMASRIRDSATYQRVADSLKAELIAFCSVARVGNLVRSEIVIAGGEGFTFTTSGVGYGVTYLKSDSTGGMLYDPAILSSMQRALCTALRDSNLYAAADEGVRARPTSLLSMGGIYFAPPPDNYVTWSTFKEKIAASFDIMQTCIAALRYRDNYTIIDDVSRDSMYVKDGLYFVENYNSVTLHELKILRAFDISHILTGRYERIADGARLTLFLQSIEANGSLKTMKSGSAVVPVDSKLALQDGVRACLREIFGTITEQSVPSK